MVRDAFVMKLRGTKPIRLLVLGLALGALGASASARAQEASPVDAKGATPSPAVEPFQPDPKNPTSCNDCHDGAVDEMAVAPPHAALEVSIHSGLDCSDCHENISMDDLVLDSANPHAPVVPLTNDICVECHEDAGDVYEKHGRLDVRSDPDIPSCWHCHGTHDVLPSTDRQSHTHPANLPSTCRACHMDVDLVKKHPVLRDAPLKNYSNSVHGKASGKGIYASATCNDCHSAATKEGKPTAHRILSMSDPESTIYHFNIPDTCGKCHAPLTRDYWEGIHGQYVKRGSVDAPVCTNCHGEHGIISADDPHSPVSAARLAQETCAPCHESAVLNEKYGLATGRLASYIDSYHGLKSKAGDATVANCASCHGAHRILPSADPTSSIHAGNLRATCGECHPGISEELAQTRIHETATGLYTGWPEFFRKLYIVLIVGTIGGMLLHNGADWIRRVKQMGKKPYVQRLSFNEVIQHWILMLSFCVLVITGFSLRFSEAGWVQMLFGYEGGFEHRGIIHRVAAGVMVFGSIWHVLYLFGPRGRGLFKAMVASRDDVRHVIQNVAYFIGLRSEPPRFTRFSYIEKAEYWALVWGTAIMTVTGFLLWFDDYFVSRWGIPKILLDISLVIHYYEAWLAFLAILVWHVYGTVFNPSVYPMNPAWLTGKMSKDMYTHEHPEGPKLKARTMKIRYEDEVEGQQADAEPILPDREPEQPTDEPPRR